MSDFNGSEIAIIGMAGRFPGAGSVAELWRNLRDGVESISFFSEEALLAAGVTPENFRRPGYVPARGVLDGEDLFDSFFFDIPPREAEALDPQQRLFLEHAWEALESAGYDPRRPGRVIGVFGGSTRSSYLKHNLEAAPSFLASVGELAVIGGNDKDFLASRVSYKLDLTGPSLAIQTACSTSLVAVHMACQSLLAGECDMALAGGVSVQVPQREGYFCQDGGLLSPDGHCRAFDARAGGTVTGGGVGLVVLKPLEDARADGDFVWAVIRGSAVNNDGAARVGFSAPGVEGQVRVLQAALGVAGVDPASVGYLEAHGTGTPLGDRIELTALDRVFRAATDRVGSCALGSVKTNLGHLDAAAGVAGLIKAVLALHHREIPPSLHCEVPNPELEGSPFYVPSCLTPWNASSPRRAGVSALGMGGTNAHVVLEEAPPPAPLPPARSWQLLVLSARSPQALEEASRRLAARLESRPDLELADVAYTLRAGRHAFAHRRAVVCRDHGEAVRALGRAEPLHAPVEAPADLRQLAGRWLDGGDLPDDLPEDGRRRRVPLPTYPFERQRYWVEPEDRAPGAAAPAAPRPEPTAAPAGRPRPNLFQERVPPRDDTERKVAEIWEGVLGIASLGVFDPFPELGGHSLMATQVQSRLRERLEVDLPLAALLENSTIADQAALVAGLRQGGVGEHAEEEHIPRREAPADRFPVSFPQLRLWMLDRLEPQNPAYNIALPLELRGPLDAGILERSLGETVRRHESLRTVFVLEGGEPVQQVRAEGLKILPLFDLSALPEGERPAEARRRIDREVRRGFDLSRGPLFRPVLLRLDPEHHVLLLVMHHIISDGWSLGVQFRELGTLYEAFAAGRPSPLPELEIQYPDFAVWQRRRLQGERLETLLAAWREQLAGFDGGGGRLDLPADRPRPPVLTFRGAHEPFVIPAGLVERLGAVDARRGGTLFMSLLAGLDLLLARTTGHDDVSAGTFIANRTRAQIEDLIGFFVNTLVLRTDLRGLGEGGGPATGFDLLERVRRVTLGAYAHQELPFERLLEGLQPPRDPSRTPLFQVMLVLQNFPPLALRFGDLSMSQLPVELEHANFDLTLWMYPQDGSLQVDAEYSIDLFDAATVRRMLGHYGNLLEALAESPEQPFRHLPLLSSAERRQLLSAWNDTAAELGADVPVHRRFEEQARRTPDAPAVVAGETVLSYRELERRSAELALALRWEGVGPEAVVGIALRRSPELIVALLAVLRAGGAYLPLDPDYPRERLELMLRGAPALLVLTHGEAGERLPLDGVRVLRVEQAVARSPALLPEGLHPEGLAYILFTSGSTGVPKGVAVTHRNLANHTASAVAGYGIAPGDRVLQLASVSFDTSAEEIWPCLSAGAALVLRDAGMLTSAGPFLAAVERLGITVLDLPTAFWHELAAGLEREAAEEGEKRAEIAVPAALRLVILGGERALPDRLAAWNRAMARAGARVRLVNSYGPTEGTIVTTRGDLPPDRAGEPTLGRPIHNVRVYMVDRACEPLPEGVPGELLIGGAGVARGYAGRPGPTAERFVPDPFGGAPGGRLYRSGDLVRWRAGGELEFVGRVDHQVKIRGFRVEVGEVEAALRRVPGVLDAVVDARPDAAGTLRLAAWIVTGGGGLPADPRTALRDSLPDFMIPSLVSVLEALPKTPAGKIDRRALPDPGAALPGARAWQAPRSELERTIAGIWQEVLGVERVGTGDSFFELGGHSLLLVQVHGRLSQALGRELDVMLLFQRPTVGALARELSRTEPDRPSFEHLQDRARQTRQVNLGRKQLMDRLMQQKKGRS